MSKNVLKKKNNDKLINILIIIGVVFLIGSLVMMFINSDKTDNYIKNINYNEYLDILKKDEYSIILLTSPTCGHCVNYKPFVNYVSKENNLSVYNVDLTTITYNEYLELHNKYKIIKDKYDGDKPIIPTPATLLVRNGEEIDSILGDIGYNGFEQFLKSNNVIK